MINTKKIFFIFIIVFLCFTKSNASIKDSLFATVGDKAITESDIINEIKIILILSGKGFSEEKREQIETAAINSTIKRTIKKIEIDKYETLQINKSELNSQINQLAANLNMDLEMLKSIFAANEVNFDNVVDQLKTELLWNNLIFEIYKNRLQINIEEIEEQLKSIKNKKDTEEYLLSEIIIEPVEKDKVKSKIDEIKNMIKINGFESVAINYSISETGSKGGDLGWLSENIITDEFKANVIKTSIGSVTPAIMLPEGIMFLHVRDKRKIKNEIDLVEAKNQLVNAEKTKILNMHSLSHYDKLKRSVTIKYY